MTEQAMRWAGFFALLILGGCDSRVSTQPRVRAHVSVHVESDAGLALVGVPVVAERGGTSRTIKTDVSGKAAFRFRPEGASLLLSAECPSGYERDVMSRRIRPRQLLTEGGGGASWILQLRCRSSHETIPIALAVECPATIAVGGEKIGETNAGAFHWLEERPRGTNLTIEAQSRKPGCELNETTVVVPATETSIFAYLEAKVQKKRTLRKRRAIRTSSRPVRM